MKKIILAMTAVATLAVSGGSIVFADSGDYDYQKSDLKDIKLTKNKAVKKFKQKYSKAKVESIELDATNRGYIYEVEGYDKTNEYSFKVDAKSGKVISARKEKDDEEDKRYDINLSEVMTRGKASRLAKKEADGGTAREWKLESVSDKTSTWEVTVVKDKTETEVTLDAKSGKVLETDVDD